MKKITLRLSVFLMALVLFGCAGLSEMASKYALSETMLNNYLKSHLGTTQKVNISGLADAKLGFSDLKASIGRDAPNRVTLSGNANLAIASLLGSQNADIKVTMSARPDFDSAKGAIYLKDLELTNYDLQSTLGSGNGMKVLLPYLNTALQYYFNNQPVYVLDPQNSPLESLVTKVASGVQVKEGQIVFSFLPK